MASAPTQMVDALPGSEPVGDADRVCAEVGELASDQDTRRVRVALDVLAVVTTGLLPPGTGWSVPMVDVVTAAPLDTPELVRPLLDEPRVSPILVEAHSLGNPHGEHELAFHAALLRPDPSDPIADTGTATHAGRRTRGLHVASVQYPKKGLGANPTSTVMT